MTHKTLEERVEEVEHAVILLVETKGMIRLTTPTLALVWAVLITLLTLAGTASVTLFQQRALTESVHAQGAALIRVSERIDAHVALAGHPVMMERVDAIKGTVDEIKGIVSRNAVTLSRVKKEKL